MCVCVCVCVCVFSISVASLSNRPSATFSTPLCYSPPLQVLVCYLFKLAVNSFVCTV